MHDSLESNTQNNRTASMSIARIVNALEAFAYAETLNETFRVLEEQQAILLLPDTLTTIQLMINDMFANIQNSDARNWRQYLHLLEDARQRGLDTAWHHFTTQQSKAVQAIDAVTSASTTEDLYQIIIDYRQALFSDAALVMLDNNIQRQRTFAPPEVVEYWQRLLDLLENGQVHGITGAWSKFKEQSS